MDNPQTSPEKKEAAETPAGEAATPKPVADSADPKEAPAKPKPVSKAAAKKEAPPKKPLVDNGDGTITDPNTDLMWKKTDAWLDMHKFYTWPAHREYVDWVNKNKDQFGGYDNWRIPTKAESMTLFDKTGTKQLMDKNGTNYPLDPIFAPGGASNTWIAECSNEKIIRMDLKIGVDTPYPNMDVWSSMRLVRKEGEAPPAPVGQEADEGAAEAAAAPADTADTKTAPAGDTPAAPKPAAAKVASGGGTPKPTPRKDFTDAEKAAMRARAKAHAAEVKARKAKG